MRKIVFLIVAILLSISASGVFGSTNKDCLRINDAETIKQISFKLRDLFKNNGIEVIDICEAEGLNIFKDYRLLSIRLFPHDILEYQTLPCCGSRGTFAYGKGDLLYLNHDNDNFDRLFWADKEITPNSVDPAIMAEVIILSKISEDNIINDVINNFQDILDYEKGKKEPGFPGVPGYVIDTDLVKNYLSKIKPPYWENISEKKILTFYTLSGWMHEVNALNKFTVEFDHISRKIHITKETLEEKIFKSIPNVMY